MQSPLVYRNMFATFVIDLSATDRRVFMSTVLSRAGGPDGRSDWPLVQLQGAGFMAPPMNVLGHISVSSWRVGELYISSVFRVVDFTGYLSSDRVTTLRCSRTLWDHSVFAARVH